MQDKDLKSIWQKFNEEDNFSFNTEELKTVLDGKANDIFTRIEKNIRIGFWILGAYICLVLYSIYFSYFSENPYMSQIPYYKIYASIDLLVDTFLIGAFVLFVKKFRLIDTKIISTASLKRTVYRVLKTLSFFKKLFYTGLALSMTSMIFGMVVSVHISTKDEIAKHPELMKDPNTELVVQILSIFIGLIIISIIILVARFVFNKLYGAYITKLKAYYDELSEIHE